MKGRTLSMEDIQTLNFVEKATGAHAIDVIASDEGVLFVIKKGDLGKAIGKGGANIRKVQELLGKPVEIVEEGTTISELLSNALAPARVTGVEETQKDDKTEVVVSVEAKSKGLAIGHNGAKIKRARMLAKRYFDVDEVKIL